MLKMEAVNLCQEIKKCHILVNKLPSLDFPDTNFMIVFMFD